MNFLARLVSILLALRTVFRARPRQPEDEDDAAQNGADAEYDPSEREVPNNPSAERLVALLLIVAAVFGFGFLAVYIILQTNAQWLGGTMGGMLVALAVACIIAGKKVVPQETHVESRDRLLKEEEAEQVVEMIEEGGQGVSRRGLLAGAGGVAGAAFVAAAAAPVASLGPRLGGIHKTQWHRGVRLVDDQGRPYLASDIEIGSMYTALPEHGEPEHLDAGLLVVKLPPDKIHLPSPRQSWAPQGILAYSKICPHAACAISLYRYPTFQPTSGPPAFTCPCHYSTFLPGEGGRLVFGPAGRSLPQLPLMVDSAGYLRAAGGFHEDIGPSWWNVHRGES
ncbi:MAG TPA: Rieske 2Fe-2S domain-containing protein [Solirubrobacteraceae bacterium]|nr:Rieske 2Fe-2S domain-containing protein [Solirubrobacteraceae bacterium]